MTIITIVTIVTIVTTSITIVITNTIIKYMITLQKMIILTKDMIVLVKLSNDNYLSMIISLSTRKTCICGGNRLPLYLSCFIGMYWYFMLCQYIF